MRDRYITKADLARQLRSVRKRHPGVDYGTALEINSREHGIPRADPAAVKASNAVLNKAGFGVDRGKYMETPLGLVGGKMTYEWGKLIAYAGLGQEKSGSMVWDGEGFSSSATGSDGLLKAMQYAHLRNLWDRPSPGYKIGSQARVCQACGCFFIGRNGSKTCKSRCRKRLQRMNEKTDQMSHLIPMYMGGNGNESRLEN